MWFEGGEEGRGPPGVVAERTLTASVGSPLTLEVNVRDPSVRDGSDPRFREDVPVRVVWYEHQAPAGGDIVFARHESTPPPEGEGAGADDDDGDDGFVEAAATIELPTGEGVARVIATFTAPGEYVLRALGGQLGNCGLVLGQPVLLVERLREGDRPVADRGGCVHRGRLGYFGYLCAPLPLN